MLPRPVRIAGSPVLSGVLLRPADAQALYLFAHGAGAGMDHRFMEAMAERLAKRRIATLRYQFPYMERGSKRPDPASELIAAVRRGLGEAARRASGLPLVVGGKSMGGRMTSLALSDAPDPRVRAVVLIGFPLHPARKPAIARAEHLQRVTAPMLFLQGTRDALAELELLRSVLAPLGPRATLHVVEGADHGFEVLKRSGRTSDAVGDELADVIAAWTTSAPWTPGP